MRARVEVNDVLVHIPLDRMLNYSTVENGTTPTADTTLHTDLGWPGRLGCPDLVLLFGVQP